ncbi:MAG: Glu/Leu/Phe/Val dehydrogenase [Nocardioidaceae bacterium]|nr:Glu/Leu/Phe/Val dehydrogenase [Nocardioidaceae bacterium]
MHPDILSAVDDWGPEKVVCVSDRRSGMRGVLVIDNTARGMGKGGTRMSATLSVAEVMRLARTMTWKWAAVDLFHGGAKAGILGDPHGPAKEQQLRAFARALAAEVPAEYVFGLDMGLSERDAAIFVDELDSRGVAVGLPRALGGLPYDELGVTGYGVAEATDAAAACISLPMEGARVAVQGFGAVGRATARRLTELGAVVVAASTSRGAVLDADGLDVHRLDELARELGDDCVAAYGPVRPPDEAITAPADILVPAALQDVVHPAHVDALTARLVVEGANMPTTGPALQQLHERGIAVVPDFIANAGGVVAAALSMDARHSPFPVEPAQVFTMVSAKMRANAVAVLEHAEASGTLPHEAARHLARERVHRAMELRGQVRTKEDDR